MLSTTRLLRDLVALPSVNPMGRDIAAELTFEHRVTDYLESFFKNLGIQYERQTVAPLRDNIVARIESPHADRTLLLEVHQDTVPTDNMTIDPFGSVVENGRLYGRGACDVKGTMAAMLHVMERLQKEKPRGAMNVWLACTVDEEHTFMGAQTLMRTPPPAQFAVVAEPTQLKIVDTHKGAARWFVETTGRSCHSSMLEQGINAIYRMGHLLPHLEAYADRLRASKKDARLGAATMSVGRIEGGSAANIVPDSCKIEIDRRLLPGEDPIEAPRDMAAYLLEATDMKVPFKISEPWLHAPALGSERSTEVIQRLGDAIRSAGIQSECVAVPYCTDASTIARGGIPSVVFGPGDIARAHTSDEWVPLDEVETASEILFRMAAKE